MILPIAGRTGAPRPKPAKADANKPKVNEELMASFINAGVPDFFYEVQDSDGMEVDD